jgi:hypothetical protein
MHDDVTGRLEKTITSFDYLFSFSIGLEHETFGRHNADHGDRTPVPVGWPGANNVRTAHEANRRIRIWYRGSTDRLAFEG